MQIERRDDRVIATLDRPEVRNAIDQATIDELHALCAELEAAPKILILTGSDGVFASGADIAQLRDRTADDARKGINTHAFIRIHALSMPVIAAVDGWALGGGAELAYAADLRIATSEARFGNPETGLGIIAAAGASWRLKQIVGDALAIEMLLTGRVLSADEAVAAGLVSSLHPAGELLEAAHALADRIASNDPRATQLTKQVFAAPLEAHPAVDLEAQAELFDSPEKHRRMSEFLDKRGLNRKKK